MLTPADAGMPAQEGEAAVMSPDKSDADGASLPAKHARQHSPEKDDAAAEDDVMQGQSEAEAPTTAGTESPSSTATATSASLFQFGSPPSPGSGEGEMTIGQLGKLMMIFASNQQKHFQ